MDMAGLAGGIINAGVDIWSGMMQNRAQKAANRVAGWNAQMDREHQLAFAREGIQWRVDDAKKAGIHPLYALGAQTPSYTPVSMNFTPQDGLARGLADAGQDIGRAVQALAPRNERERNYVEASQTLSLEKQTLENQLLASQIRRLNQPATPPGLPASTIIPGQGNASLTDLAPRVPAGKVESKPLEVINSVGPNLSQEPDGVSDVGYARTATGFAPVPSSDVKNRIEDQFIPELTWAWRNQVLPNVGMGEPPPRHLLPKGAEKWVWNPFRQEWQAGRSRDLIWGTHR